MDKGRYGPRGRNHGILPQYNPSLYWPKFVKLTGFVRVEHTDYHVPEDIGWVGVVENIPDLEVSYAGSYVSLGDEWHWYVKFKCLIPLPSFSVDWYHYHATGSIRIQSVNQDFVAFARTTSLVVEYPPTTRTDTGDLVGAFAPRAFPMRRWFQM